MPNFAILFIAVYVSGLAATLIMGPVWGFYLYELVYFLNPKERWWSNDLPQISYSFYVVLFMLGMFVINYRKHEKVSWRDFPEAKWFILIIVCYIITVPVAANPVINNLFLSNFLVNTWVISYIAFRLLDNEKKIELALLFYMVAAAYIGYEAMVVGRNVFGRVEGIGTVDSPEANTIAASIVPVLPLVLYFGWQGNMKFKVIAAISGVLVVNGLILINSRGAFLGLIASVGYFFVVMTFSKYKLPKQRLFVILLIVAAILVTIRLMDNTFIDRMMTIETQASADSEGSGGRRINFWYASLDMVRDHPLGVGIYGFETLSHLYLHDESYFQDQINGVGIRAVHSLWFQCLTEIGYLGFFGFMMLLYTVYRHLRRAKLMLIKHEQLRQYYMIVAIEAAFLGFLISGSFINMFRSEILYWMLLFSISACVVINRNYGQEVDSK
jgi:hypothetical protein